MAEPAILSPFSVYIVTADRVFANVHVLDGANFAHIEGIGVEASLGADATVRLAWQLPSTLPEGTCKLLLNCFADAIAGIIKVNPKWKSIAAGEDASASALNAEGTTATSKSGQAGSGNTLEWGADDDDELLQLKWTMDADTPVAGEMIVMDLVFETSGWTLAQILTVIPFLVWE